MAGEEGSENLKTWVLKVSIHCEGCKKKVNKILKHIYGVVDTKFDSQRHRVTVIGNVDGDTLVRKLLKAGKHAELLHQVLPEKKEQKQEKVKNNENQKDPQKQSSQEQSKPEEIVQVKPNNSEKSAQSSENSGAPAKNSADGQNPESKSDGKKPENLPPAATDKKDNENDGGAEKRDGGAAEKRDSGNGGKKKGKKGQKSIIHEGVEASHNAPGSSGSPIPVNPSTASVNHSPPRQHVNHPYPTYGQPPVYVMSYSTAHPSSSYSETYYAQPPTYTYAQPPPYSYGPPPPSPYTYAHPDSPPLQPADSFTMFSDENANGCSIM